VSIKEQNAKYERNILAASAFIQYKEEQTKLREMKDEGEQKTTFNNIQQELVFAIFNLIKELVLANLEDIEDD
jgi:hypothetical protein